MSPPEAAALRLKAIVEADPGALIRLLQLFQIRNVIPRRVRARRLGCEFIEAEIELDAAEVTTDIAAPGRGEGAGAADYAGGCRSAARSSCRSLTVSLLTSGRAQRPTLRM